VKWVVYIYLTAHLNSIRCLDGLIYLVRLLISAIYSNKPSIPFVLHSNWILFHYDFVRVSGGSLWDLKGSRKGD